MKKRKKKFDVQELVQERITDYDLLKKTFAKEKEKIKTWQIMLYILIILIFFLIVFLILFGIIPISKGLNMIFESIS